MYPKLNTDVNDFDSTTQHVFFFQDEDVFQVDCLPVYIPITNDDVNEAEQVFSLQLSVVSLNVQNPGTITLSRNLSLARIIDDDRKFNIADILPNYFSFRDKFS